MLELTVAENVLLPAWSAGSADAAARLASVYRAIPEVEELRTRKALHLSGGQQKLVALAHRHGATPYMVLLAAWQAILARHSGRTDFAVGSPVAGRSRPELEGLVGMAV